MARPNVYVPPRNRSFKPRVWRDEQISEETTTEQLTMLLLSFAMIVVGIGLWTVMPGGAILFMLVITPPVIAIYVSLGRHISPENWDMDDRPAARFLAIALKSFLILWLLTIATGIALFISFWITCSNALSHQYGKASRNRNLDPVTIARLPWRFQILSSVISR
jgi:hypothetical protein